MKKLNYDAPKVEIEAFESNDIITTSSDYANLQLVESNVKIGAERWQSAWNDALL